MNPFYFGTRERRLFGIYEPAAAGIAGKRAAILCHPWGSEYLHAHRTMRQLAIKLSGAGFHTLRFDYFGTGDSAGEMLDADLGGWESDIELAISEMKDVVSARTVTLIGLRLGATIAARVAQKHCKEIDALVLWDPIVSGDKYLIQLDATTDESMRGRHVMSAAPQDPLEMPGFPLTQKTRDEFRAINLNSLISPPSCRTLMLVTEPSPLPQPLPPVPSGLSPASLEIEQMASISPWVENPATTGMVPLAVIQRIVNWLR